MKKAVNCLSASGNALTTFLHTFYASVCDESQMNAHMEVCPYI
jgi:hypothetical protein